MELTFDFLAMVSMLDRSVGTVMSALREKQMLDNSIVIFMSDNGAQTQGIHANHGSNYPLKGVSLSDQFTITAELLIVNHF